MKQILVLFVLCLFLGSCTNSKRFEATIDHVDSLMDKHQDSVHFALGILDSLKSEYPGLPKRLQMRYQLIYAKGMNKGYIDFTTDSVMKQVVDYYDHFGTSNEQMLAHYLLGCTYRDMGEYPVALSCYNNAVEKADSTDSACDCGLLTRIYQQEASLFLHQNMPQNAKEVLGKAEKTAWLAKDTLAALIAKEHLSYVYEQLQDYNAVIDNCIKVRNLYLKYGYNLEAVRILGVSLRSLLYTKQYSMLKRYMDIYEAESGYFSCDSFNNAVDYSNFYNIKGMYYNVTRSDSALVALKKAKMFRANFLNDKEWAIGMYNYFKNKNDVDSMICYSELALAFSDSITKYREVTVIQQVSSIFRYNRYQQLAQQRTIEAKDKVAQMKLIFISIFLISITISLIIYLHLRNLKIKRKLVAIQLESMKKSIADQEQELLSRNQELNKMQIKNSDLSDDVLKKSNLISELTNELTILCDESSLQGDLTECDSNLWDKAIVKKFVVLANEKKCPSENQWMLLAKVFEHFFPNFRLELGKNRSLTEKEYRLCMLIRLGFKPKELAILMNMSKTNISNRRRMSLKIFGEDLSVSKFDARIRQIRNETSS